MTDQATVADMLAQYPGNRWMEGAWGKTDLHHEQAVHARQVHALMRYGEFIPESRDALWIDLLSLALVTCEPMIDKAAPDTSASATGTTAATRDRGLIPDLATIRIAAEISERQTRQLGVIANLNWRIAYRDDAPGGQNLTVINSHDAQPWLNEHDLPRLGLEELKSMGCIMLTSSNLGIGNPNETDALVQHTNPKSGQRRQFLLPVQDIGPDSLPIGDCQLTRTGHLLANLVEPQRVPGAVEQALKLWRRYGINARELTEEKYQELTVATADT